MDRPFVILCFCASSWFLPERSLAQSPFAPKVNAYYDQATGHFTIETVKGQGRWTYHPLLFITSQTNSFVTSANAFANIPGTVFDPGDLPFAFAYLNFPYGKYDLGNIAIPGTPISDFSTPFTKTNIDGYYDYPDVVMIAVPEPAALVRGASGLMGIVLVRRRASARQSFSRQSAQSNESRCGGLPDVETNVALAVRVHGGRFCWPTRDRLQRSSI